MDGGFGMFEEKERKRREAISRSGFLFHKDEKKEKKGRETTGLLQDGNKSEQKLSQRFHLENAYGHIALGANEKKELGLVLSGKQEYHEKLARENERNLDLNRAKRQNKNMQGEIKTNGDGERESALALFAGKNISQNQILEKLKEYERTRGNDQLEKQLPFLTLEKDREEKQRLISMWQEAREQGLTGRAKELELEGRKLSSVISRKEQQERQFRLELGEELQKLRKSPGKDKKDVKLVIWKRAVQISEEDGEMDDAAEEIAATEEPNPDPVKQL